MTEIKHFLASDTINAKDLERLEAWIRTQPRLTMDKLTREYEHKWSNWIGRKYSVACNSGSSANLLMYEALRYGAKLHNQKIIVPACGWPTTITPALQLRGWEPIMCEADSETFGLDLNYFEDLLRMHQPSTVIMVQALGVANKMREIMALKEKYGFYLMEDTCAAMGSSYEGRSLGTYGDLASMSTYFGHQFSTIEGGLVSTDDENLYHTLLMLRSHGWDKELPEAKRIQLRQQYGVKTEGWPFTFFIPGYNFRITDLQSFLGIHQLDKMNWLINRRFQNHLLYQGLLKNNFGMQKQPKNSVVCSIHFCALAENFEHREKIHRTLTINGIETRLYTAGNLGRHPFWVNSTGKTFHAPVADKLHDCGFFLPNNPSLTQENIKFICHVLVSACEKSE